MFDVKYMLWFMMVLKVRIFVTVNFEKRKNKSNHYNGLIFKFLMFMLELLQFALHNNEVSELIPVTV